MRVYPIQIARWYQEARPIEREEFVHSVHSMGMLDILTRQCHDLWVYHGVNVYDGIVLANVEENHGHRPQDS